ncbi:hypothetical protein KAX75_06980 [candidate division WOR-3 bacterium]|nr:hypothetical protein [candidate division WOR-3 bacterium]
MKIKEWKRIIILSLIFFVSLSIALPFYTLIADMAMWGTYHKGLSIADMLFHLTNWFSILLKIYPTVVSVDGKIVYDAGAGLFHPLVIIANAIGWGLIGFVVGLIISVIKDRKRRVRGTNRK